MSLKMNWLTGWLDVWIYGCMNWSIKFCCGICFFFLVFYWKQILLVCQLDFYVDTINDICQPTTLLTWNMLTIGCVNAPVAYYFILTFTAHNNFNYLIGANVISLWNSILKKILELINSNTKYCFVWSIWGF